MGFLDRLLGRGRGGQQYPAQNAPGTSMPSAQGSQGRAPQSEDERAIAKYRYMLRTAPPEQIEQAHAEAFAKLTPQQRQQVLTDLSQKLPEAERPRSDDPRMMARAATRAEMQRPGFMQTTFGGMGMGGGMGGMGMGRVIGGSMLGTIAGVMVGSAMADMLFDGFDHSPEAHGDYGDGYQEGYEDGQNADDNQNDDGQNDGQDGDGQQDLADGGYDQAGYDQAGYDQAGYDQGGDAAAFDDGGYDSGGFDAGGFDGGGFDGGGFDGGGFDGGF